ncbi:Protein kinase [Mycena sanguinolenta]|uniref:Protein kinase n=1 Tax=Mycena sanguinolenta TaxID=230812 RepID=A0A8H6XGM8_9AGAR|nr:Protein kinase [Mycena sanguinolenta]
MATRAPLQQSLRPITELTTAMELGQVFRDIFQHYRALYEKAGLIHGDIRLNNLRYCKKDRKNRGILIDLDENDKTRPIFTQKTGSYMALDLLAPRLRPPCHFYRFDLESLFYVMLAVSCHYHNGKKVAHPPLETWQHLSTQLYLEKYFFMHKGPVPIPTPNFGKFMALNVELHAMFADGYDAQSKDIRMRFRPTYESAFDPETLGGHLTFDAFQRILDKHLPLLTFLVVSKYPSQQL